MAWTNGAFDNTKPADSRDPRLGAGDIREWKKQVAEFLGTMLYGLSSTETNEVLMGFKHLRLMVQAADPGATANCIKIYAKDVGGKAEHFAQDEDGDVIQITSGGKLNAVLLTGDQTVAGIKTFSSIPLGPDADPTTDLQLSRKSYVDDAIAAAIAAIAVTARARAYRSGSDQAFLFSTITKVQFNAESYDVGSDFDHVTNFAFTVPTTGYYLINAVLDMTPGGGAASGIRVWVYKNGASIAVAVNSVHTGFVTLSTMVSTIADLEANDVIDIRADNPGAGSGNAEVNYGADKSFMEITRLI